MSKAKNLLSPESRAELLANYKADKKTDAPANISDKTLITHYGNDAQKQLLAADEGATKPPTSPAPKGVETETAAAAAETETDNGAHAFTEGAELTNAITKPEAGKDAEYVEALNAYTKRTGHPAPQHLTTAEIIALNNEAANAAKAAAEEAAKQKKATRAAGKKGTPGMVAVYNTKTKETTTISQQTWDKFVSKDADYKIAPETPAEVKNLTK